MTSREDKAKLYLVEDIDDETDHLRDRSRYLIEESERGFTISSPGRITTYVTLREDYQFLVTKIEGLDPHEEYMGTKVGPYNFRSLLTAVAKMLLSEYKRPSEKIPEKLRKTHNVDFMPETLKKWVEGRVQMALNHKIHEQWARLIALIPPHINTIAKKYFRTTLAYHPIVTNSDLYERHPYLVKDLGTYFSALAMFHHGQENYIRMSSDMIAIYGGRVDDRPLSMFDANPVRGMVNISRHDVSNHKTTHANITEDEYFSLMDNWRNLYSYNFKTYRALDVTLNNVKSVSGRMLAKYLPIIYLERPIYQRLELSALLAAFEKLANEGITSQLPYLPQSPDYNQRGREDRDVKIHNANLFQYATDAQVRTVMERVGNYINHGPFNHRKITQISTAIGFILDFPERHRGNIVGLADKSIDWHRHTQERMEEERRKSEDPNTLNALPPITLPEDENIRFLSKVGDLYDESSVMKHCVYSYKYQTINGNSFIFHVDKDGDMATIEISREGDLIQAQGIHNRKYSVLNPKKTNAAILYGRRILSAWGRNFPEYNNSDSVWEAEMGVRQDVELPDNDGFVFDYGFGRAYDPDLGEIPF